MSIIFEMYIECIEKQDADQIASYFSNVSFSLLTGNTAKLEITQQPGPYRGLFGVVIWPHVGASRGIRSLNDALDCTETGLRLYKHLQAEPNFDFAHVGIEAEQYSIPDLSRYVNPTGAPGNEVWLNFQCVLSKPIYEKLGRPRYFREFNSGHLWNRYSGELYRPLFSKDKNDLNDLCRQLFPEAFDVRLW